MDPSKTLHPSCPTLPLQCISYWRSQLIDINRKHQNYQKNTRCNSKTPDANENHRTPGNHKTPPIWTLNLPICSIIRRSSPPNAARSILQPIPSYLSLSKRRYEAVRDGDLVHQSLLFFSTPHLIHREIRSSLHLLPPRSCIFIIDCVCSFAHPSLPSVL